MYSYNEIKNAGQNLETIAHKFNKYDLLGTSNQNSIMNSDAHS